MHGDWISYHSYLHHLHLQPIVSNWAIDVNISMANSIIVSQMSHHNIIFQHSLNQSPRLIIMMDHYHY
jgi:hypothetical protein